MDVGPNPPPSYLSLATYNANCSAGNIKMFLKTNLTIDIVFIQEPYIGFIHNIPSSSNPLGVPLEGGISHPEWIAIYPPPSTPPGWPPTSTSGTWPHHRKLSLISHPPTFSALG